VDAWAAPAAPAATPAATTNPENHLNLDNANSPEAEFLISDDAVQFPCRKIFRFETNELEVPRFFRCRMCKICRRLA